MMQEIEAMMEVMESAFDPRWGEAWNHAQVLGSLQLPNTHINIIDAHGKKWEEGAVSAGFTLSRSAPYEEELLLIAVKPEYRRSGLGRLMLSIFLSEAHDRGAERVFLEMRINNSAANLYRSLGFKPIGQRAKYYTLADGSRLDAITLACDIQANASGE